jgi:hypothetical protein
MAALRFGWRNRELASVARHYPCALTNHALTLLVNRHPANRMRQMLYLSGKQRRLLKDKEATRQFGRGQRFQRDVGMEAPIVQHGRDFDRTKFIKGCKDSGRREDSVSVEFASFATAQR